MLCCWYYNFLEMLCCWYYSCLEIWQTRCRYYNLPVSSHFPIRSMYIYFKFLCSVLTFNNLIPNNYFKFVFLIIIIIIIIIIINNIIGTKFSAEPTAIFKIDLNKEIEHTYETSSLIQITWRHIRENRSLQAYTKSTLRVVRYWILWP